MLLYVLEKYLVSRLKFNRQILEFLPGQFAKREEKILELLKQLITISVHKH